MMKSTAPIAEVREPEAWEPHSWRRYTAAQQPVYEDQAALEATQQRLRALPPLVTSWEVLALRHHLAEAAQGRAFVLQGGDCAESFAECRPEIITNRLKVLLQMSLVLVHGLQLPVVRIGRFAGQYAKPRSSNIESRNGIELPSYRGDLVNAPEFSEAARRPDPARLIEGHAHSAMTMNFVRSLSSSGFADLHHPDQWDLAWVDHSPLAEDYHRIVRAVMDSVRFSETLAGRELSALNRVEFFTAHEALLLQYEQALTRRVPRQWGWFNLSTHFPWIGKRTAQLDGAHVEYMRGIRNPIGIKIGPDMETGWLLELLERLDPHREPGRISLIHRIGAGRVAEKLPRLIQAVQGSAHQVLWICDPMHGNTESTDSGRKTRRFDNIRSELEEAFELHDAENSRLGGVHLELTGEAVTECLGGARQLEAHDLGRAYRTTVDPRLNCDQALELSMAIVHHAGRNN